VRLETKRGCVHIGRSQVSIVHDATAAAAQCKALLPALPLLLEEQHVAFDLCPVSQQTRTTRCGEEQEDRTDGIVFEHAERSVRARPHECLVVARHGHRDQAHGNRAGFRCRPSGRVSQLAGCGGGNERKGGTGGDLSSPWVGVEVEACGECAALWIVGLGARGFGCRRERCTRAMGYPADVHSRATSDTASLVHRYLGTVRTSSNVFVIGQIVSQFSRIDRGFPLLQSAMNQILTENGVKKDTRMIAAE
jgi:hypothetical protein